MNFNDLLGRTLTAIESDEETVTFTLDTGEVYSLQHIQDCCENVVVDDIAGDLKDLIGSPLTKAEEVVSRDDIPGLEMKHWDESFTWTFYHLATVNGYVTIRFYGSSNGYYSESVSFERIK